jgi:glycine/serine hydroxymethyltransferase
MLEIADLINEALNRRDDLAALEQIRGKVRDLTNRFPLPS